MNALLLASALLIAAPAVAQPYQALGTEPFWSLTVDRATITYRPMQGRAITVAKPRPIVGINGELYRARGMTVDITHVRCSDGMSDRIYAETVRVTIGRRTLSGCGGAIMADLPDPSVIANTRWRIAAIDGRPVRLDRPATIAFTRDRIEGRICNGYGGRYRIARGTLTAGPIVATQMACAGELGEVERRVFAALARPLKAHSGSRDTLVLSSSRSSITLRRDR